MTVSAGVASASSRECVALRKGDPHVARHIDEAVQNGVELVLILIAHVRNPR